MDTPFKLPQSHSSFLTFLPLLKIYHFEYLSEKIQNEKKKATKINHKRL